MNAKEFRPGNLLLFTDFPAKGEKRLTGQDIAFAEKNENWLNYFFKPIKLTEEWFIDHGFQKDKDGVINIGKSLYWLPSGYWGNTGVIQIAFGYSPLINCPCEFVHKLQNIYFAFYGKEINIELL